MAHIAHGVDTNDVDRTCLLLRILGEIPIAVPKYSPMLSMGLFIHLGFHGSDVQKLP